MGWRIIYIEEASSIKLYLDNIKITNQINDLLIPLSDIHTLVIDNQKLIMTIPLLTKCSEYNVNVILCSIDHMPTTTILPFHGNFRTAQMLKKQIEWPIKLKEEVQKAIIKNKINNQIDILKKYNKKEDTITTLYKFYNEVLPGDIENREGLAAKMYFRELFGNQFKRFEDDIVNAGLNYGYGILRSQISKTLIAKGLNTTLGIFHKGYNNNFNLSDDIIEVFRPIVDEYVYTNLVSAICFKREHRIELINLTTKDVYINESRQSIFNAISIYVDSIINVFETGNINKFLNVSLIL